jgi:predicted Zn-dependent peptidase
MYHYKTETLKNGIKILKIPNKNVKFAIIQILMKLGNDIETKSLLETSHFIEHLFSMFTSPKYPDGKLNRENLSFKNIDLDAEVVNKSIKFTLEFDIKHSEYVVDLLTNALINFKIDNTMFKQEKNAVIEELNELIKDADYKFEMKINSIMYKGHQRAYTEQDRLNNTKKISSKDIENYFKKYFTCKHYIIGIFGNLPNKNYNQLKQNMEHLCNKYSYTYKPYSINMNHPIIYYKKQSNVSNIKLYFNLNCTMFDKDFYIIRALIDILCGDLNSLLLKKLRNEQGLVYHCSGDFDLDEVHKGLSHIEFTTLCSTKNVLKVITFIIEILNEVKHEYIDNRYIKSYCEEIKLSKKKEVFSKRPLEQLSNYSRYYLWDKPIISFNQEYSNLCNVNRDQLRSMAKKIFKSTNIILAYDGSKQLNNEIIDIINKL